MFYSLMQQVAFAAVFVSPSKLCDKTAVARTENSSRREVHGDGQNAAAVTEEHSLSHHDAQKVKLSQC